MTVLYILGSGSRWGNKEIFYSIKSVQKHLKGFTDMLVVGEDPGFDVKHIFHPDKYDKDTNICAKIARACRESITDDFILMNDDVFFIKDIHVKDIPKSYIGSLKERMNKISGLYATVLRNTYNALTGLRLPYKDFDGHMPIPINKHKFLKSLKPFNWGLRHGYAVKSIYFNYLREEGVFMPDLKINKPENDIPALLDKRWCFSIGDNGLTKNMKEFISSSF